MTKSELEALAEQIASNLWEDRRIMGISSEHWYNRQRVCEENEIPFKSQGFFIRCIDQYLEDKISEHGGSFISESEI